MTRLTNISNRKFTLGYCGGIFVVSVLAVSPFVTRPVDAFGFTSPISTQLPWIFLSLALASGMSFAILAFAKRGIQTKLSILAAACLFAAGVMRAFGTSGFERFAVYGDAGRLQNYLGESDFDFGRWLLGLAVLREMYFAINAFFIGVSAEEFVRVAGALGMFISAMWLSTRNKNSLIPWLVVISPMWILFSIGYDEYYPFVAGLLMVASLQVVSDDSFFRPSIAYVLVGVLPIVYIGALPISLALLLHTWSVEHDFWDRLRGALRSLISAALAIEVGGEFVGYIRNLSDTMNLGGRFLDKEVGSKAMPLSSRSFLADPSYALSLEHAVDIFFWLSCGIGLVVIVAALMLSGGPNKRMKSSATAVATSGFGLRRLAIYVLVGLAIFYLIFMLPLLGPTRDIDLYFISMFILLLFAGSRLDRVVNTAENPSLERLRFMQLSAFGFAPATIALVVFGVSR